MPATSAGPAAQRVAGGHLDPPRRRIERIERRMGEVDRALVARLLQDVVLDQNDRGASSPEFRAERSRRCRRVRRAAVPAPPRPAGRPPGSPDLRRSRLPDQQRGPASGRGAAASLRAGRIDARQQRLAALRPAEQRGDLTNLLARRRNRADETRPRRRGSRASSAAVGSTERSRGPTSTRSGSSGIVDSACH